MRLLVPPMDRALPTGARVVSAAGWELHLEAALTHGARLRARAAKPCPRCYSDPHRRTGRAAGVFGLYPFPSPPPVGTRTGAPAWEDTEPSPSQWSRQDLASWLGADLPDGTPPDLFDLAPPPFSVSTGVTQAGGLALRFPLEDDLALRCGATRSKLRAVITLLRPRHLWLTLPLHPFGGWGRFESSRGKDASPGSGCGRRHLDFLLDLGRLQSLSGGTFSVLHHLTSTAWREPAAVALLASVPRARLLLGPTPGLPFCLKTTLPSLLPLTTPPLGPISPRPSPRPCSPRRVSRPGPACGEPVTLPFASPLGTPPGRTWGGGGFAALLAQQKRYLWASRATAGPSSKANGGSGGRLP